jgi:hypothetical protein
VPLATATNSGTTLLSRPWVQEKSLNTTLPAPPPPPLTLPDVVASAQEKL